MENIGLVKPPNEEQLSPEKGGPPDGLVKVLIGFKEKPGPAEQAIVKGAGGKIKYTYKLIPAIAASIPEVAIEALKKNPNITNIEFDSEVYALDAELDNSWGVKRIGAGIVHESGNKGAGVKIAIIDTGIDYNHEDLNANFNKNLLGYDFVNSDNDPMDDDGHGTHVAGIIAAEDNDDGVVGVAPDAELYALKVLDDTGSGYMSDVVLAIQWATDPDGDGSASDRLDIINMSLGGQKNIFLEWACNLAYLDGLLLVAAAGNGGSVIYPAAYDSVIAVSATDRDDALASFSSTGKQVELAAPGVNINSTLPGNEYSGETWSGTSMASPHVAGTAALVWKANPAWSNDEVRTRLQETAEDLGAVGWDSKYGYGLVDADEAAGLGNQPSSEKMHVAKIDMLLKTKGSLVNAIANVIIADKNGVPVGGATVSGHWSDTTSDSDSGITNASGQVSLKSDNVKKPSSGTTFTFTVDDVVKDGWTYDLSGQTSNSITS
jgi:subtilisin family serine protease